METILETLKLELRTTLSLTSNNTKRYYEFPVSDDAIKVAVGMRRSGKTHFLYQNIRKYLARNVDLDQILYINFEDERISPINHKTMGRMIDTWYSLHPDNHNQCCYLFLDEVQNVEGWPHVLRRMLDTKNIQIYVTGSSAQLMSKDIATSLKGRSLTMEILPYNYLEYLTFHDLRLPSKPFGKKMLEVHHNHLIDYFRAGGFPGIQNIPANEQLESLQSYVETVLFRDVVARHQISNVSLMKHFISYLLKNVSSTFSINKYYQEIKDEGQKVAKDTLYSYLSYLEDAFLIFTVPLYSQSPKKMQTAPKKIYAIDNGLVAANTFDLPDRLDIALKNQLYLDFRRQGKKVFYCTTTDGYEVDFVTQDIQGNYELIQVMWESHDSPLLARKERVLRQAENELGFRGRLIDWKLYLHEQ